MRQVRLFALLGAVSASVLAGCGEPELSGESSLDVAEAAVKSKTGTVTIRVLGDQVVHGTIVSTPIAGVSVYDGDWHAVQALGQTDANGDYKATLSRGTHQISVMMMTSSHSLLQSVGSVVTVAGKPAALDIHVAPTQVEIIAQYDAGYGNALYVTGETDYLGNWQTAYKLTYQTYKGGWDFLSDLPLGAQFKLILAPWVDGNTISVTAAGVTWEQGNNHVITPPYQNYESLLNLSPTF